LAANPTDQKTRAQQLYDGILRTANRFLYEAKGFSVEVLKWEDPSFAEVAAVSIRIAEIITLIADDFDPMMGQKATEYCELMRKIGVAIEEDDQVALDRALVELERRPGV
jgi:hypothetical protein